MLRANWNGPEGEFKIYNQPKFLQTTEEEEEEGEEKEDDKHEKSRERKNYHFLKSTNRLTTTAKHR